MLNLSAFLSYIFVVTFTPGPNNIMSMANAIKYGYKKTLNFTLGVFTGFFIIMILCNYFNLILFNIMPKVKIFMGILGSAYMMYLAFKIMNSKEEKEEIDEEDNREISDGDISKSNNTKLDENKSNLFITGVTMQFVNPKAILYGITVASNFIIPFYKSSLSLILSSIFLSFLSLISTSCWALFGSFFNKFLSKYERQFNIVMGVLLIYSAISIIK